MAEGAVSKEDAKLSKKELKKKQEEYAKKYPSISYKIAKEIEDRTGMEIRVKTLQVVGEEAEVPARMTESCLQDWDLKQPE